MPTTGDASSPRPVPAPPGALRHALRHGAHAARLALYEPALVDLLVPGTDDLFQRAYQAEKIIRAGINGLDPESAAVLLIIYELTPRAGHKSVEERRKKPPGA